MIEERDLVLSNGIHCIADIHSELYARLKKESQAVTPWVYQKQYGKFVTYFVAVIIFLSLIKSWHLCIMIPVRNFFQKRRTRRLPLLYSLLE